MRAQLALRRPHPNPAALYRRAVPFCSHRSFAATLSSRAEGGEPGGELRVGAAQFTAAPCLSTNTSRIIASIREAGDAGIDLLAFAETATTGYFPETIATTRPEALHEAEGQIAEACGAAGVAAVVGTPFFSAGRCFNSATVIDRRGSIVGRQHKLQLVPTDDWAVAGEDQAVFWLAGIPLPLSVIVCHDKRYPELVRLPVLAGARLIVYISHETWHDGETSPTPNLSSCAACPLLTTESGLTPRPRRYTVHCRCSSLERPWN